MSRDNSPGQEAARRTFERMVGKVIQGVYLRSNPARTKDVSHTEWLTVRFTDGSQIDIVIGSNGDDSELKERFRGFRASDLSLSFVPLFTETGESPPKRL